MGEIVEPLYKNKDSHHHSRDSERQKKQFVNRLLFVSVQPVKNFKDRFHGNDEFTYYAIMLSMLRASKQAISNEYNTVTCSIIRTEIIFIT